MKAAIQFDGVSKKFTIHHERARSFQELALGLLRRNSRSHPQNNREEFWALRDVSFTVEQGEAVGLVGPNGAGKSTALKLISRIIEPTAGRVAVNGRVGALLELGAGFHPDLTGRENIFLNGSILGLSRAKIQSKLDDIIAFAELERFIDMPVKHYSSGMYMRLAFSVAIHTGPEILLIDEVLAVGDISFQRKCIEQIKHLQNQGVTIVFVSHAMAWVADICENALWLQDGIVQSSGPAAQVVQDCAAASSQNKLAQYPTHEAEENGATEALQQVNTASARGVTEGDDAQPRRWGNGDVIIQDVRLLGADGMASRVFYPDQSVRIEFDYLVQSLPENFPAFGVAVHRSDGLWCYGTNTALDGVRFPQAALPSRGTVVVELPSLQLLHGDYTLDVAVHNTSGDVTYDYIKEGVHFNVLNLAGDRGVFRPELHWALHTAEEGEEGASLEQF